MEIVSIVIRLDVMLAKRKMSSLELAEKIGLTPVMLSRIKTGKIKGIRFDTLELICNALDCEPGDILELERKSKDSGEQEYTSCTTKTSNGSQRISQP